MVKARPHSPALRRACGRSFQAGRAFGYDLGHAVGFEAGYDKGYTEGSTLGDNNGFLRALQLLEGEKGAPGMTDMVLLLLDRLAAAGAITITLSGEARREAAALFALLGATVRLAAGEPGP